MSSDTTPRLGLPDMPETPELYPDIVADAFARLDAFTDLYLKGQFVNTPPSTPVDGDAWLIGGSPTGAWAGYAYKIATCRDGAWTLLTPFNGLRAYVASTGTFIVYADGVWTDWAALIGAGEASIAADATCDIGAAGSLFLQVTGTTGITSFGAGTNRLRFLRFAGTLILAHNATSLILPGAANIVTAAGDCAVFASDSSGNWRCHHYARADGRMVNMASPAFTGTVTAGGFGCTGTFASSSNAAAFVAQPATNTTAAYFQATNTGGNFYFAIDNSAGNGFGTGSAYGRCIYSDGARSIDVFVNSAVSARFAVDGSVLFGTTTPAGAGAIAANYLVPRIYTFATLPASPPNGARAMISDSSATAFRASAAGGGSTQVPVHYVTGSGWLVG